MKILISTPNINLNISKVVSLLKKLNYLESFWTTLFLPFKIKFLKKSYYKEINLKFVRFIFFKQLMRKICIILNIKKLYSNDENIFSIDAINKDLDIKVAKYVSKNNKINIIYSYEDCSKETFKVAKEKNIQTICDLTSPYWLLKKNILDQEKKMHPDWHLSSTEVMSEYKCKIKDEELSLSDRVIVASSFTAKSLRLFNKKKKLDIKIVPYGIDLPKTKIINLRKVNEKFKIFFAGRPTISKGIHYLIKSLIQLDFPWQIEIAGSIPEKPVEISKKLHTFFKDERCKFLGQISNKDVLKKMQTSHVFLFPSLFEGFGQVLLESLANSLPIVTTENTGGMDFIENGKNSFITPIRDEKNTVEILNKLYLDEEFRRHVSENSFLTAKKFTWEKYQNEIKSYIKNIS